MQTPKEAVTSLAVIFSTFTAIKTIDTCSCLTFLLFHQKMTAFILLNLRESSTLKARNLAEIGKVLRKTERFSLHYVDLCIRNLDSLIRKPL